MRSAKSTATEKGARVPLIVNAPGIVEVENAPAQGVPSLDLVIGVGWVFCDDAESRSEPKRIRDEPLPLGRHAHNGGTAIGVGCDDDRIIAADEIPDVELDLP